MTRLPCRAPCAPPRLRCPARAAQGCARSHRRCGATPRGGTPGARRTWPCRSGRRGGGREHQRLHVTCGSRDLAAEVAEIDLSRSRRPFELKVTVARGRSLILLSPPRHVSAHRRVGAPVAALVHQPVEDPPGGVALLSRRPEVRFEYAVDPGGMGVGGRMGPHLGYGGSRRHVLHVSVPGDGVAAHSQLPGCSRPGYPPRIHLAHVPSCVKGHGHLPFLLRAKACQGEFAQRKRKARPCPLRLEHGRSCDRCPIPDANGAHIIVRHLRVSY